jgi:hypothetical protein
LWVNNQGSSSIPRLTNPRFDPRSQEQLDRQTHEQEQLRLEREQHQVEQQEIFRQQQLQKQQQSLEIRQMKASRSFTFSQVLEKHSAEPIFL